jgi:hypothetical protein
MKARVDFRDNPKFNIYLKLCLIFIWLKEEEQLKWPLKGAKDKENGKAFL